MVLSRSKLCYIYDLLYIFRQRTRELLGCTENEFVCDDWSCIPKNQLCNGVNNCPGGSDEDETTCSSQSKDYLLILLLSLSFPPQSWLG